MEGEKLRIILSTLSSAGVLRQKGGYILFINEQEASRFEVTMPVMRWVFLALMLSFIVTFLVSSASASDFGVRPVDGAVVSSVEANSPAERADIQQGDRIIAMDGTATPSATDLISTVRIATTGDHELDLIRAGRQIRVRVLLTAGPQGQPQLGAALAMGFAVGDVAPASRAERLGLRPGDVIYSCNSTNTVTYDKFEACMALRQGEDQFTLYVMRGDRKIILKAGAAILAELVYDADVPPNARQYLAKAVDTVDNLLAKYKHQVVSSNKITIVVTADTEGFIQALMLYDNESRADAEKHAEISKGGSIGLKSIIIVRGSPKLNSYPGEAVRVVSHEVFHQVQYQGHTIKQIPFLDEGSAELFSLEALESARIIGTVDKTIHEAAEKKIREAPAIPDVRELAYHPNINPLMQKGYPIYPMSVVMAYRLVQDNGFENIILYYQLLQNGTDPDKAFLTAFRVPMASFLSDMNTYFAKLRGSP